jgi:hypothetical protein
MLERSGIESSGFASLNQTERRSDAHTSCIRLLLVSSDVARFRQAEWVFLLPGVHHDEP